MGKEHDDPLDKKTYKKELRRLQIELCKLQSWVVETGAKIVVIFEGRDTAGKGGVIKRIMEEVSPRVFRVVALPAPTEKEQTQFYFQRYAAHLPSAGEVVIFDRSWYNRAGVEPVMGFCTQEEYEEFLLMCPSWEIGLIRSEIRLIKYFLVVSHDQQLERFESRIEDPTKQWKLSPLDVKARTHWYDYSRAYDRMFTATDTSHAPWHLVRSDDKKRARLNCISHLLDQIPYEDVPKEKVELPPLQDSKGFSDELVLKERNFVEEKF
ncbi:polyphosphate kinase 2 [Haloferula helveola]|uniref:ADP/GDP-polyphosphate phosphotransferase n=1 Tax=Haloferula helveola TaxID=490095 RepID=A0ABM7RB76_9BACT|nr:polyphosphate kinase 2 [Haloferula helveola]